MSATTTPTSPSPATPRGGAAPVARRVPLDRAPSAMVWVEPGRRHEILAVPTVTLQPGDVLVEIELSTICGSDVHTVLGHRSAPTPLVLGHEQVGRVVAVGDGALSSTGARLQVGTRVVWSLTFGCERCERCISGRPQKCLHVAKYGHEQLDLGWELSGGFATHMHLRAGTAIVPVIETVPSTVLAPVSCGTATSAAALDAARAIATLDGAVVAIFGAGLIGLTACAMATDLGARVIVLDPDPRRRMLATRFGAVAVADPTLATGAAADSLSLRDAVQRVGALPRIAIEASGSPLAVAGALDCLDVGGVAVLVGSVFPTDSIAIDPERVVRHLLTLRGVHNYAPHHLQAAVDYIQDRHAAYPFADLVGQTVALRDLDNGLEAAATGRAVRVAVDPRTPPIP